MACVGKVKSFNDSKGWGFISYEGKDVFVHVKDCRGGKPEAGDTVNFDLDQDKKKGGQLKALKVTGGTGSMEACTKGAGKGKTNFKPGCCSGVVKSFNSSKGWGFIDMNGQDV